MRLSAPIFRLRRQARLLAREAAIPHHQALDRVAKREGFRSWSHLVASDSGSGRAGVVLSRLEPGDLVLLAARPGQGKTLLALDLVLEAVRAGRYGTFFTLEYTADEVRDRVEALGRVPDPREGTFTVDTSERICADYIIENLGAARPGDVAAIDYLQLLDQKRRNPELGEQVRALRRFAADTGAIVIAISQIDRTFAAGEKRMPGLADVRLPNPVDLSLFTKSCFLHAAEIGFEPAQDG